MMAAAEDSVVGLNVSRETIAALQQVEALVRRWNPTVNLVSKASLDTLWSRHILDSAQVFSICPKLAESWVDLGSGGGFPGLVVAVLAKELRPDLAVTLVEADKRKAAFLRQAAKALDVQVGVRSERIESLHPQSADVLSARALAPLPILLGFAEAHLATDGICVFPKGARHVDELADARTKWSFDVDTRPSMSDPEAAILVIRNIRRAND